MADNELRTTVIKDAESNDEFKVTTNYEITEKMEEDMVAARDKVTEREIEAEKELTEQYKD